MITMTVPIEDLLHQMTHILSERERIVTDTRGLAWLLLEQAKKSLLMMMMIAASWIQECIETFCLPFYTEIYQS